MSDPKLTAEKLVTGVFDVLEGDNVFKAEVAGEVVDQLIGSDPHALVRSISGVPESMVEMISDGLVNALKAQVLKRISGGE